MMVRKAGPITVLYIFKTFYIIKQERKKTHVWRCCRTRCMKRSRPNVRFHTRGCDISKPLFGTRLLTLPPQISPNTSLHNRLR
ncbi:hypothetical protein M413DRAFT_246417 [Hebeloma cylindrosporum]|uniref:Uncharacterized protein n=1 Tax=Hebeloma cylindrosporum TaxID=76867 RepID=A0A0C2YBR0_HEBCY|nr:hypothetical protein M413DRAFT_246417 [Hebeloma cylindrosporum h7]